MPSLFMLFPETCSILEVYDYCCHFAGRKGQEWNGKTDERCTGVRNEAGKGLHLNALSFSTKIQLIAPCKGIQESLGIWIPDSRYWILDPLSVELGFRITIVIRILESLSWIPDSKPQDSVFRKQTDFSHSGIRIHLHGTKLKISQANTRENAQDALKKNALCTVSSVTRGARACSPPRVLCCG